ncbi:MAG: transposase family protein [Burkholderiales bacterium]
MIKKLIEHLSKLDGPRCPGKVEHRLIDILVIAICAVIACAESWEDIALYGRSKLDWLRQCLLLEPGIAGEVRFVNKLFWLLA